MDDNIYLDNAATTKISPGAKEAMLACMEQFWGNPSSLHSSGRMAAEVLEKARKQTADALHCRPNEIVFTSGGSEADNQALLGAVAMTGGLHIVSTAIEHPAILETLRELQRRGAEVTLVFPGPDGIVPAEDVISAIRPDTCLVSMMFGNNETGVLQPVRDVSEACAKRKILFHTDAVQAAGQEDLDLSKSAFGLVSISGHKFHGPRGSGALYIRGGMKYPALIHGGGQENGLRSGTENLPAIAGMAVALSEAVSGLQENGSRVRGMRDFLVENLLREIPDCVLVGDRGRRLPGIAAFCFKGVLGEALVYALDNMGISVSSGSACSSNHPGGSHVLKAMGIPDSIARGAVRFSIGTDNTMEEIQRVIPCVTKAVQTLRAAVPAGLS